jgi:hypothetical protein
VLMVLEVRVVVSAEAVGFVRLFEPSSDKVGVLAPAPGLGVLIVLEVRVVVCAIAGVAIMAAMAIAPYRCDLMFRLRCPIELLER